MHLYSIVYNTILIFKTGHGWYHKFMNRNRNKLRRHNASSTHSKLLRFVCESKERARVNLGQNRIKHQRDTVYQLISKGYKLGEESFVTIMVCTAPSRITVHFSPQSEKVECFEDHSYYKPISNWLPVCWHPVSALIALKTIDSTHVFQSDSLCASV